jgi:dihydroxyacetone kinase-like protein
MSLVLVSPDDFRDMLLSAAQAVIKAEPELTRLDQAVGDGDHGIGMKRGFTEASTAIAGKSYSSINDVLKDAGMAMISSMGGASGIVFGTMFFGGGAHGEIAPVLTTASLANLFGTSYEQIEKRAPGRGGKTMSDAFGPAVESLEAYTGDDLVQDLQVAAQKAKEGSESTKEMIASHGRARSLGERALGHADPGSVTVTIIFDALAEAAAKLEDKKA